MSGLSFLLTPQALTLGILALSVILSLRQTKRYDVVALIVLVAIIFFQILPLEEALGFFGNPVIIIVASMYIMGRALVLSGIIDVIVRRLEFLSDRPIATLAALVLGVTILSAFVNNIGALAIVIPIALHLAKRNNTPATLYLLPLAFASHLGGFLTLIGSPRNIIISTFREEATGVPFAFFDFIWVGGGIVVAGLLFITTIAWRLLPAGDTEHNGGVHDTTYTTEAEVTDRSTVLDSSIAELATMPNQGVILLAIMRDGRVLDTTRDSMRLQNSDILVLRGTATALTEFVESRKLSLYGIRALEQHITTSEEYVSLEAVVTPYSSIVGMAWDAIGLAKRFGTNFIGLARERALPKRPLSSTPLQAGDILLLQGRADSIHGTITTLGLLPLAERELTLGRTRTIVATLFIIVYAIVTATISDLPLVLIFLSAAVLLISFNLISLRQAYDSIDWSVIVLLAGMLALGAALTETGAADIIASSALSLVGLFGDITPVILLAIVLIFSMIFSDFMNTTAAAVVMAPVAIVFAQGVGASIDPFLIAVAIGASSAFLTPVGNESNSVIMDKGHYRLGDLIRVGLPLEIILIVVSLPLILIFWPLF